MSEVIELKLIVDSEKSQTKASKLLSDATQMTQASIKDAMQKGAVWLQRGNSKKRLRRATKPLESGDVLLLNYDSEILQQAVPKPDLIHDAGDYSVWFKPYGLSCQGSRWGDFSSIARWVEVNFVKINQSSQRPVYLVHRLDRATSGLMILAHSKKAARRFSNLFAHGKIDKRYLAIVTGDCSYMGQSYTVSESIDDKPATTIFSVIEQKDNQTFLAVKLLTGRKHQIRKHLSGLDFPIVGDRLYSDAQADEMNLQLQAVSLRFTCPFNGEETSLELDQDKRLKFKSK